MATRAVARPLRGERTWSLGAFVDRHFMWIALAPAIGCLLLVLVYPVFANVG